MQVKTSGGICGTVAGAFGKSGKFRVEFDEKLPALTPANSRVFLTFKRYVWDKDKKHISQ